MRLIRGIWTLSRAIAIGEGSISDLGEATLYIFLCIVFGIVAVVLLLFGIDFDTFDRWFDPLIEPAVTIVLKGLMAITLFFCLLALGVGIYDRVRRLGRPRRQAKGQVSRRGRRPKKIEGQPVDVEDDRRLGWGGAIFAIVVGYFCYVGLTM